MWLRPNNYFSRLFFFLLFPSFTWLKKSSVCKNIMKNKPHLFQVTHLPNITATINSISKIYIHVYVYIFSEPGLVVHTCNLRIQKAGAG